MADCIEQTAINADGVEKAEKIKTHFAYIIVGGAVEKPYYSILYFDPTDKTHHIGFSSYCLDYVREWLTEEFEIVEDAADVAPVVRCGECERRDKSADLTDTVYCSWLKLQMRKTDFCSYGERKET